VYASTAEAIKKNENIWNSLAAVIYKNNRNAGPAISKRLCIPELECQEIDQIISRANHNYFN